MILVHQVLEKVYKQQESTLFFPKNNHLKHLIFQL